MLSRPVALPRGSFLSTEDISWLDMGLSMGSSLTDSGGGFDVKYSEQENFRFGSDLASSSSVGSSYSFLKKEVRSAIWTCWSGSSHLAFVLRSCKRAHHSFGDQLAEDCIYPVGAV